MEPLQDAILAMAALAATAKDEVLASMTEILEGMRATDTNLRARLFVLQVARKYSWEAANKMARRKAGDYEDPDLTKVLEEMEKKEEKNKREREKDRKNSNDGAKRGRFANGASQYNGGARTFGGYQSPLASNYPNPKRNRPNMGYGYRARPRQNDEDKKCNNCNEKGHFWRVCPNKK